MECCSGAEETCYDYDDGYFEPFTNQYCAAIADGGCPCPENQVRCGQGKNNFWLGLNESYRLHFSYYLNLSLTLYQTLITTTLAGAQMFAATNRPKKPVPTSTFLVLLTILVHLLPMVAVNAQEIKCLKKERCYIVRIDANERRTLYLTYI